MATETTSLFTSVKGLPLPTSQPPLPITLWFLHLQEDMRQAWAPFSISELPFSLYLTEPFREGEWGRAAKAFFWRFFAEVDWLLWKNSVVFVAGPAPAPVSQGDPIRAMVLWGDERTFTLRLSQWTSGMLHLQAHFNFSQRRLPDSPSLPNPLSKLAFLALHQALSLGVDLYVNCPLPSVGAQCDQADEVCMHL